MSHSTYDHHPNRSARARFRRVAPVIWSILGLSACAMANLTQRAEHSPLVSDTALSAAAPSDAHTSAGSCEQCHRIDPTFSHPTGIVPRMRVPADLPLDRGRLTCTTCHEPTPHSAQTRRTGEPMLRAAASSGSLCLMCHSADDAKRNPHAGSLEKAHFSNSTAAGAAPAPTASRLDAQSQACMNCHDGSAATDAGGGAIHGFSLSGGLGAQSAGPRSEHPVGIRYDPAAARRRDIDLVPASNLNGAVKLIDHTVGCGSCHSVYSPRKAKLVETNQGSKLCLSCHAM